MTRSTARPLLWVLALMMLLAADTAAAAPAKAAADGPAPDAFVPDALRPWIPWALHGMPEKACPYVHASTSERRCAWPSQLELELSDERGSFAQRWQLYARQHPDARQFQFQAREEGSYWFASRTVQGPPSAARAEQLRPELVVLVDLQEPKLNFESRVGPAGEVESTWEAADPNLHAESLKIEYQPRLGVPWRPATWDRMRRALAELIREESDSGQDRLARVRNTLLELTAERFPRDPSLAASILDVTPRTYQRWLGTARAS